MKTKKLVLLIALVIFGYSSAQAQIPGFTLGLKAGYLYSTFPYSNSGTNSVITANHGRSGYQIGAFARIGGKTYLQPEFNYEAQRGTINYKEYYYYDQASNSTSTNNYTTQTSTLKFNRIDIPILLGHKFIALPLINLRGYIGPDFGFKTYASDSAPINYNTNDYNFRTSTVGGILGVGVDVGPLTVDARYNLGFTQVNRGFNTKLNSLGIALGFKFL